LSKNTYNLIPYYERGPFSARVSYGYRSQYFTSIGRLAASQFTAEYKELDASASWNITDHFRVTVNAENLLDQLYDSFNGVQAAPVGLYKNGRLFSAGFTYRQ
jgi:iron complex outermembrane receptor protein